MNDDDLIFDFDKIIRDDLSARLLSEMLRDDPDQSKLDDLWNRLGLEINKEHEYRGDNDKQRAD